MNIHANAGLTVVRREELVRRVEAGTDRAVARPVGGSRRGEPPKLTRRPVRAPLPGEQRHELPILRLLRKGLAGVFLHVRLQRRTPLRIHADQFTQGSGEGRHRILRSHQKTLQPVRPYLRRSTRIARHGQQTVGHRFLQGDAQGFTWRRQDENIRLVQSRLHVHQETEELGALSYVQGGGLFLQGCCLRAGSGDTQLKLQALSRQQGTSAQQIAVAFFPGQLTRSDDPQRMPPTWRQSIRYPCAGNNGGALHVSYVRQVFFEPIQSILAATKNLRPDHFVKQANAPCVRKVSRRTDAVQDRDAEQPGRDSRRAQILADVGDDPIRTLPAEQLQKAGYGHKAPRRPEFHPAGGKALLRGFFHETAVLPDDQHSMPLGPGGCRHTQGPSLDPAPSLGGIHEDNVHRSILRKRFSEQCANPGDPTPLDTPASLQLSRLFKPFNVKTTDPRYVQAPPAGSHYGCVNPRLCGCAPVDAHGHMEHIPLRRHPARACRQERT